MATLEETLVLEAPSWAELSQEIFVVRSNGKTQYLPFDTYFTEKNKLAWWNSEEDHHFCLVTPNGYQPINLTGPVITKVLPWNVQSARLPEGWAGGPLEPGYLIDLRALHLSRLHFRDLFEFPNLVESNEELTESLPKPYDGALPEKDLDQLKQVPLDNLYILSWRDPLEPHRLDEFQPYQLHYVSKEQLDATQEVETLPVKGEATADFLHTYYEDAGVQVGRLNPLDIDHSIEREAFAIDHSQGRESNAGLAFFAVTCYVANLKSFCR